MLSRLPALLGIIIIIFIGYLLCNNKSAINRKTLVMGFLLQMGFAFVVLKGEVISNLLKGILPVSSWLLVGIAVFAYAVLAVSIRISRQEIPLRIPNAIIGAFLTFGLLHGNFIGLFFNGAREFVKKIIDFSSEGAQFVFGSLAVDKQPVGFVFAFGVLPTIIFVASLFAILYYLRIMQKIVAFFAKLMTRFLAASGAESTSVAASIFMGQTEAPLTIRPYLPDMTMSELMTIMTAGMAHVSGGIMAAYVMVAHVDITHLLTAVIMTAPGAIMLSKLMVPETETPKTGADIKVDVPIHDVNIIDAAARGATEGGILALNVTAMLVAFIALIALVNGALGAIHGLLAPHLGSFGNYIPSSLQQIMGWIFGPLAWSMGVPWKDAAVIGGLMGERMVLNEFVAFMHLGPLKGSLDPRSFVIATYALCGFANFSSIAIQIGGIGALAPTRRHDLAKIGLRAMLAGTLANFLTAAIAGILV